MGRILKALATLGALGGLGYLAFAYFWGVPAVEKRPLATDQASIDAGEYLTTLGDCVSCHTAENGASFAGGRFLETPFGGGIYSANITPSALGIGGMTSAEFYQVLTFGADNMWAPIYPAMPYTSYHLVTRDDSDAMFAYLMSLDPIDAAVPENTLPFPFNIRLSLFGWNALFAERKKFKPDASRSDEWNRGAYLVNGLGHCGECHTPRNAVGALENYKALSGAKLTDFEAPDITASGLARQGWTHSDLVSYFATGAGPQGSAFGEMHLAIKNSLSKAEPRDRSAIASYLLNLDTPPPETGMTDYSGQSEASAAVAQLSHTYDAARGKSLYLSNCSLCHGGEGQGIPGVMPALYGNSTVSQADAVNLVLVIDQGLDATGPGSNFGPMPSFGGRLSVAEITDLVNYLRLQFGNSNLPPAGAESVQAILGEAQK